MKSNLYPSCAVLALALTLGSFAASAAAEDAKNHPLRDLVRRHRAESGPQNGAANAINPTVGQPAAPALTPDHHLSSQARSQLRSQLQQDLRAQRTATSGEKR